MTANIEYSIKELFDKLDERFDKLEAKFDKKFDQFDKKFDQFDKKFDHMESKFDKLETKVDTVAEGVAELKTEVKVLDEKLVGINKRLDTQEFINRGVVLGLLLAVLGGFAKLFGFGN